MIWCSRCLMPSTRPRISFDEEGVCNACRFHESKAQIDWQARAEEFRSICRGAKSHSASTGAVYDCIVPFSGGKDSATVAWRLREAGLRPLLVTYGQLLWTDVGRRNFDAVARAGFDILYWRVDQRVSRALARRWLVERGHPKLHYDAGVNAVPLITAVKFGIPLVFYAEHGESEYGGHVLSEEHRKTRDLAEVLENQVGDDARNWATDGISEADLYPYIMPQSATYPELCIEGTGDIMDSLKWRPVPIKAYYFSHFFRWDIYENAKFARERLNFWQANHCEFGNNYYFAAQNGLPEWWGKSDGSFEGFDSIDDMIDDLDYWLMHIKFGFGRSARMASRLIQNGHMTREQGLELVRRYDGEFPRTYLPKVLEYLDMTEPELVEIVDRHRNPEIWEQKDGEWQLKHPPA